MYAIKKIWENKFPVLTFSQKNSIPRPKLISPRKGLYLNGLKNV